jgi:hypothetical protein
MSQDVGKPRCRIAQVPLYWEGVIELIQELLSDTVELVQSDTWVFRHPVTLDKIILIMTFVDAMTITTTPGGKL